MPIDELALRARRRVARQLTTAEHLALVAVIGLAFLAALLVLAR